MIRIALALSAMLLIALSAPEAMAQAKKKSAQCVANFHEACMKRCGSSGGQLRYCNSFCDKRKSELGC